jgi:hypothetical protein
MISPSTDARLRYLEIASQCLLVSSPAISAHLQAERNSTLDEGDNETNTSRSHRSCNACGTILIPGWSCKAIEGVRQSRAGHTKPRQQVKMLLCSACGAMAVDNRLRKTDRPQKPSTESRTSNKAPDTRAIDGRIPNENSIASLQSKTTHVKASNRRTRNKKSTLQSMLADQKKADSEKPKGFGMDLTDLMQP